MQGSTSGLLTDKVGSGMALRLSGRRRLPLLSCGWSLPKARAFQAL